MCCVTIRDCEDKDIKAVIGLLHELKDVASIDNDFLEGDLVKIFEELKRKPEIYLNLVAEINEKVVGFISVIFYKTFFHKAGTALINEFIIRSNHRGKGIGKLLIESAKEEAIKRGMDELEVGTEISNKDAQYFYKKCGFNEEYVLLGMEF